METKSKAEEYYVWNCPNGNELEPVDSLDEAEQLIKELVIEGGEIHPDAESVCILKKVGSVVVIEGNESDKNGNPICDVHVVHSRLVVAETLEKSEGELQRYYPERLWDSDASEMKQSEHGEWIKHSEASALIAKYKAALSASERFRAEDGMSHINEANNLRDELAKYKAELAESQQENERLKAILDNADHLASLLEDTLHGREGDLISEIRKLLTTQNAET